MSGEVNQSEWVELTGEDIMHIWTYALNEPEYEQVEEIAKLVEEKLKEKNANRECHS
jgi:hypothetical protein